MYGYGTLSNIALAFIAVALLVVMVDQITKVLEGIMKRIPFLPDAFEWTIAYIILLGIASVVCWQGRFDLFVYLNFNWHYKWEGYLLTGALVAGGSSLLVKQFKVMGLIPSIVSGVSSMFGYGGATSFDSTIDSTTTPEQDQEGPL